VLSSQARVDVVAVSNSLKTNGSSGDQLSAAVLGQGLVV